MGLHAYCVVPEACAPGVAGIEGAGVQRIVIPPVAVWASEHEHRPAPDLTAARAHDAVIRSAHGDVVTPVPLRFGQWFADEAALRTAVHARVPAWSDELQALRGTAEMGLRFAADQAQEGSRPVVAATGTAYMHALLERSREAARVRARREQVLAAVRSAVAGCILREFVAPEQPGTTLLSVAHLVQRAQLPAYQAAIAPVPERFAELRFFMTGPWPPYSFVA